MHLDTPLWDAPRWDTQPRPRVNAGIAITLTSIISYWQMASSRNISPEAWVKAREVLVYYFSRRHASERAEDLAHETLMAVWNRHDFEFQKDEDFLRVCLGFARRISQAGHRDAYYRHSSQLDQDFPSPNHDSSSFHSTESRILLSEIQVIGKAQLRESEWQLILKAAELDQESGPAQKEAARLHREEANRFRVYLHRARKKLELITGYRGGEK